MAQMIGALASAKVRGASRKVRTKSCREPHLDRIAMDVEKKLAPGIGKITKQLRLAGTQRTATSEHNAISNRAAYRRRVLKMLARIVRQGSQEEQSAAVRVLGNVLGPAGMVVTRPK